MSERQPLESKQLHLKLEHLSIPLSLTTQLQPNHAGSILVQLLHQSHPLQRRFAPHKTRILQPCTYSPCYEYRGNASVVVVTCRDVAPRPSLRMRRQQCRSCEGRKNPPFPLDMSGRLSSRYKSRHASLATLKIPEPRQFSKGRENNGFHAKTPSRGPSAIHAQLPPCEITASPESKRVRRRALT